MRGMGGGRSPHHPNEAALPRVSTAAVDAPTRCWGGCAQPGRRHKTSELPSPLKAGGPAWPRHPAETPHRCRGRGVAGMAAAETPKLPRPRQQALRRRGGSRRSRGRDSTKREGGAPVSATGVGVRGSCGRRVAVGGSSPLWVTTDGSDRPISSACLPRPSHPRVRKVGGTRFLEVACLYCTVHTVDSVHTHCMCALYT